MKPKVGDIIMLEMTETSFGIFHDTEHPFLGEYPVTDVLEKGVLAELDGEFWGENKEIFVEFDEILKIVK